MTATIEAPERLNDHWEIPLVVSCEDVIAKPLTPFELPPGESAQIRLRPHPFLDSRSFVSTRSGLAISGLDVIVFPTSRQATLINYSDHPFAIDRSFAVGAAYRPGTVLQGASLEDRASKIEFLGDDEHLAPYIVPAGTFEDVSFDTVALPVAETYEPVFDEDVVNIADIPSGTTRLHLRPVNGNGPMTEEQTVRLSASGRVRLPADLALRIVMGIKHNGDRFESVDSLGSVLLKPRPANGNRSYTYPIMFETFETVPDVILCVGYQFQYDFEVARRGLVWQVAGPKVETLPDIFVGLDAVIKRARTELDISMLEPIWKRVPSPIAVYDGPQGLQIAAGDVARFERHLDRLKPVAKNLVGNSWKEFEEANSS